MGRKKKKTVSSKYIFKTHNRGQETWVVCTYDVEKKQRKKYFNTLKAAKLYLETLQRGQLFDVADFARLPTACIDDIRQALAILPAGKSLREAVFKTYGNSTETEINAIAEAYKNNKAAQGLKSRHECSVKSHIDAFVEHFKTFENITEKSAFEFLNRKGNSRSTLSKWFADLNDFMKFAIRKDVIKFNPLDKLTINDFGRAKTLSKAAFITVDTAKKFIEYINAQYPQYLKYFVLTMFSGIRVAEVLRMKESYIDYEKKAISLPAEITKKNRAEYLDDFEPNLWAWLDLLKDKAILAPYAKLSTKLYANFSLPQNFARHSFATYHYSLYRDPKRTAAITHHTEQELMNTYMDALVDKETAKDYFKILPEINY